MQARASGLKNPQMQGQKELPLELSHCEVIHPYTIPSWHPSPLVEISRKAEAARKKAKAQQVGLGSSDWYVQPARKGFGGQEVQFIPPSGLT